MWVPALILISGVAAASPQVNFPLNSQFPPIARVGSLYSFQFAVTTFQPESEKLQYSLIGNPPWLSLSGRNRTLYGTPRAGDTGIADFTIAAAGEAGAVANMESRLFVTDEQAPTTKGDVFERLSTTGQLSGPQMLTLPPSKPFDVGFPSDAFETAGKDVVYHATLADHTPLPAWISFDAASLRFAGTTPPSTSSPQTYGLVLIASDNPGYAAASIPLSLVISDHRFLFKPLQQEILLTKGEDVNIFGLRNKLFLDNTPIGSQDIQSASADIPSWLSFDDRTLDIIGVPPTGLMSQDISISVTNKFGGIAEHSIRLRFKSLLFDKEVGALNITLGQHFEYKIPKTVFLNDDDSVAVDFGHLAEWLQFDPSTLTISGTIPEDVDPQDAKATLTATSKDGKLKDSQSFQVQIVRSDAHRNPDVNDLKGSGQPSNIDEGIDKDEPEHHSKPKAAVIAGSVVAALVGSVILILFACILCRCKKKSKGYISPRSPKSPRKADISRPIMIHDEWAVEKSVDPDLEKGDGEDTLLERTPEHPPQINLNLALKKEVSPSPVSSIGEGESKILNAFADSSWGFNDEAGPSHRPHDSMRIPTAMARRESEQSDTPTKYRRRTTTVCHGSQRSIGLPINRRITGLGHGRHRGAPSSSTNNISAYQRPLSYNSNITISTGILSRVSSGFGQSSTARHTTQLTTPMDKRCSIRMVSKNTSIRESLAERRTMEETRRSRRYNSLVDRRTIDEKRQSYIRKRASAQSPFFGASSSRISSSSYKLPPALANETETPSKPTPSKPTPSPLANTTAAKSKCDGIRIVGSELPESLRIRRPPEAPSVEAPRVFPSSLRQTPTARSFTSRHTTSASDRVYKRYERLDTAYPTSYVHSQLSSRQSLRAQELKSSLNSLTGSKVYEDAELSESMYSTEEEEIEDYEKRTTVKPNQFSLPPLDLYRLREGREGSKRESKENKRDSKREVKKTNHRDPTPYPFHAEHGGKENQSSTFSLGLLPTPARGKMKAITASESPKRPKTIATTTQRPALHSRSGSRTTARSSTQRQSQIKPLSRQHSGRSQSFRPQSKSGHSRSQSRQSTTNHTRDRSRTQSSAYPYFDMSTLPATLKDPSKAAQNNKDTTLPQTDTTASLISRDPDGNILNYALNEDPTIEELASSSIGFRTSNGRINSSARRSRLAQQMAQNHSSPYQSNTNHTNDKRDTALGPATPTHSQNAYSIGLGLSLLGGRREKTPGVESEKGKERTPLGVLDDGNGTSPDRARIVEGKGKRPVSVEVDEELRVGASRKGRTTWGSLKAAIGSGYWDGRDRETKVFL